VKLILPTFGGNTDVRRARIFGAEAVGENGQLVDRFERRLAVGLRTEYASVRALAVY